MDDKPLLSIPLSVPGFARLFAWVAMAVAALQLINGLAALVLLRLVDADITARLRATLQGLDSPVAPGWLLLRYTQGIVHLPELALAQVALALLTVLAGIGLLRGRRWSQLYFVAWLALIAIASGAWLVWHVAERIAAAPATAGWVEALTDGTRVYADMLLVERSALEPTMVLIVTLWVLALVASPQALVRTVPDASGYRASHPRLARAVVCAVLGLLLPVAGALALGFGLAAYLRLLDEDADRRRTVALCALVAGSIELARDVYLASRWLA